MKPLLSAILLLLLLSCQSEPPRVSHGFYADFFEAIVAKDFSQYYLQNDKDYQVLVENYNNQMYGKSNAHKTNSEIEEINEGIDESIEEIKENFFKGKGAVCYFEIDSNFMRRNEIGRYFFSKSLPFREYFDKKDSMIIINALDTPMPFNSKSLKAGFFSFVFDSTQPHDFTINRIVFSKPYFYQNKALIFCSYQPNETCGHRCPKAYLFENIKGYWQLKAEDEMNY